MKCRNCKYLRWAEEYPGMPFFGWCDNVNDSPDMDMERECGCFESATHADIIRAMSDEELAVFLESSRGCPSDDDCEYGAHATLENCIKHWTTWLQQPAEEDT